MKKTTYFKLSEDIRIYVDPYQWAICRPTNKKNKKTGEIELHWRGEQYFPTLSALVEQLVQEELTTQEEASLINLQSVWAGYLDAFKRLLAEHGLSDKAPQAHRQINA